MRRIKSCVMSRSSLTRNSHASDKSMRLHLAKFDQPRSMSLASSLPVAFAADSLISVTSYTVPSSRFRPALIFVDVVDAKTG